MKLKVCIFSGLILIGGVLYLSIMSRPKAQEATYQYEHYYDSSHTNMTITNENSEGIKTEEIMVSSPDVYVEAKQINWEAVNTMAPLTSPDLDLSSISLYVNREFNLPKDYVPSDLVVVNVPFDFNYFDEKKMMRQEAATALEHLFAAAETQGLSLCAISGYRSYPRQYQIFTNNIVTKGKSHTLKYSAIPGTSEHQTGLAVDVSTKAIGYKLVEEFVDTPEGIWLNQNSYKYGFIVRYSQDKEAVTGYAYEPWHIRYVGVELAAYLYVNDLTLDEYYSYQVSPNFDFMETYRDIINYTPPVTPTPTPELPEELPEEEVPEGEISDDMLPNEDVTEETLPDDMLPNEDVTKETLPDDILPDEDVTVETLPDDMLPNEEITEEEIPEEDATKGELIEEEFDEPVDFFRE